MPGLVDLHLHGFAGIDCTEADAAQLQKMALLLARRGTTAFLATLYPASIPTLCRQLEAVRAAGLSGAHLEGPFVNPLRAGALPRRHMVRPNEKILHKLLFAGKKTIQKITVAPELPGALALIRRLRSHEILVSMGHSDATWEQAARGAQAGARSITHWFNAMRKFHHREPGLAGFGMGASSVYCELIADGVHVGEVVLDSIFKRQENFYLVSDGLKGTGQSKKQFSAGGKKHSIRGGVAYLSRTNTLSGSCSTLLDMVRGLVRSKLLPLERAVYFSSTVPSSLCAATKNKGDLQPGKDADFLVLGRKLQLEGAYVRGLPVKAFPSRSR